MTEAEDNRRLRISLAHAHGRLRQYIQDQTLADVKREVVCRERDELRAENERLQQVVESTTKLNHQLAAECVERLQDQELLRVALAEMLESFTEPEDDNDILRRARAALGKG